MYSFQEALVLGLNLGPLLSYTVALNILKEIILQAEKLTVNV